MASERWITALLLAAIMLLAFGLRTYAGSKKGLVGTDEAGYLMAGRNLWRGEGLAISRGQPFVGHPALHGIVVGGVARCLHMDDLQKANGLCFAVFGALGCCAMFLLARQLYGTGAGLVAAALYATVPSLSVHVYYWDSTAETLCLFFLLMGCYGFSLAYFGNRLAGAAAGAAFFALAGCVRNDGFVFMALMTALLLAVKVITRAWPLGRCMACLFLCLVAFSVAYSPYARFLWRHSGKIMTDIAQVTMRNYDPIKRKQDPLYAEKPATVSKESEATPHSVREWQSLFGRVSENLRTMFDRREVLAVFPYYLLLFLGLGLLAEAMASGSALRFLFIGAMIAPMFAYVLFFISARFLVVALPGMLILVTRGLGAASFQARAVRLTLPVIACGALLLHSLAMLPALARASQHSEFENAGQWISGHTDRDAVLMTRKPEVAFYADRDLARLPYVEDEPALYAAAKAAEVRYVVFDEARSLDFRPKLEFLLDRQRMLKSLFFEVVYSETRPGARIVVLRPK
jgi:hypothetical protein